MDDSTELGSRGLRLAAGLVDVTVVIGAAALLALLVQPLASLTDPSPSVGGALAQATAILAVLILPLMVLVLLEARLGTSPGKALFGLKVRTEDGERPGLRRAASRTAYRVSPVGLVGASWALATGQDRTWHDSWTGTVVRCRPRAAPRSAPRPVPTPVPKTLDRPPRRAPSPMPPAAVVGVADLLDDAAAAAAAPASPAASAPTATNLPAATGPRQPPAACLCREVASFEGDEAVAYAGGHLRVVRRRPKAGELVLVCPVTRAVWLAREPWAAPNGLTTLARQDSSSPTRSGRDAPAVAPRG